MHKHFLVTIILLWYNSRSMLFPFVTLNIKRVCTQGFWHSVESMIDTVIGNYIKRKLIFIFISLDNSPWKERKVLSAIGFFGWHHVWALVSLLIQNINSCNGPSACKYLQVSLTTEFRSCFCPYVKGQLLCLETQKSVFISCLLTL